MFTVEKFYLFIVICQLKYESLIPYSFFPTLKKESREPAIVEIAIAP